MKRCIFYLPYELVEHGMGARMMRPRKMIQAFRDIGYEVFVIQGFSKERRNQIAKLKKSIQQGAKYDFMYTESSTMPTLLTDPHHLPLHPFLDFGFFKYVKKQGIKIGLFYCDIYWKFDSYGTELNKLKREVALINYAYDIKKYEKQIDRFYVPDKKMLDYLNSDKLSSISDILPPGAEDLKVTVKALSKRSFKEKPLHIFYVGGIGNQYQIAALVEAVSKTDNCILTLCCREPEWSKEKKNYEKWLNDRIQIIHKKGDELETYYQKADICSLVFKGDIYREMAMPYKAFEYLGHEIPVIATQGTAIGRFTEENGTGWVLPYNAEDISTLLREIIDNPNMLVEKRANCSEVKKQNLWKCRAKQVESNLK